ncbi:MAG: hemolysin family protein [Candidatus Nanopelagicales bacterium]
MNEFLLNLGVVLVFTLVGGFFAAAEIALVSLRESQVQRIVSERGKRGRRLADLVEDPNRFLAAVQVGVTMAGFLSAGFGASRMSPQVAPIFVGWGMSQGAADAVAFVLVTVLLVYISLVLGELTPKRIALQRAEGIAVAVAGIVDWLARISRPFIWLLSRSTDLLVRVLGGDPTANREEISEDELRGILASQASLTPQERELIDDVFEAGEREVREVMVPRTEVDFIDASTPAYKAARVVASMPHSRYPVYRDSQDDVVGFVHIRDILDPSISDRGIRVGELARDVLMLPGSKRVLPAMFEMRSAGAHLAIVVDEYGGTAGIVTLEDLVEELVGDIRDEYDLEEPPEHKVAGVMDVDGLLNLEDFGDEVGFELPEGPYETVAGFVMAELGHLPEVGESVDVDGRTLTVTELDGRRAARIRVTLRRPVDGEPAETGARGTEAPMEESGA